MKIPDNMTDIFCYIIIITALLVNVLFIKIVAIGILIYYILDKGRKVLYELKYKLRLRKSIKEKENGKV